VGAAERQSGLADLVLFLDENHCRNRRLIAVLEAASVQYVSHLDRFAPGTPDTEWLPEIARAGWCLLTSDVRIRYNQLERKAVQDHKIRMFCFSRNNLSGLDMAYALEKALPQMRYLSQEEPAPFIAAITRAGEVSVRVQAADF
jgi:hypothetical protein